MNYSAWLESELNESYSSISKLFSQVEGVTIEKYIISQKIEKVKELITYEDLRLSEIADQLNYSSVAHLSNQFKQITGFTPRYFKTLSNKNRKPLDSV